jgi:hypothetical protein
MLHIQFIYMLPLTEVQTAGACQALNKTSAHQEVGME